MYVKCTLKDFGSFEIIFCLCACDCLISFSYCLIMFRHVRHIVIVCLHHVPTDLWSLVVHLGIVLWSIWDHVVSIRRSFGITSGSTLVSCQDPLKITQKSCGSHLGSLLGSFWNHVGKHLGSFGDHSGIVLSGITLWFQIIWGNFRIMFLLFLAQWASKT